MTTMSSAIFCVRLMCLDETVRRHVMPPMPTPRYYRSSADARPRAVLRTAHADSGVRCRRNHPVGFEDYRTVHSLGALPTLRRLNRANQVCPCHGSDRNTSGAPDVVACRHGGGHTGV